MCEGDVVSNLISRPPPSWNELFRMAQNARVPTSRQHLSSCLELLLDYCSFTPSFSLLCDRLECIAFKEGFEFLTTPFTTTDSLVSIFLSTPLFYIEVLAEDKTGIVSEVKMGYSNVVKSCTDMFDALKHNDFKCFIEHLNGFREFISSDVGRLNSIENDIIRLDNTKEPVNSNENDYLHFLSLPFGLVTPRIDGLPLRIHFFVDPVIYIRKCVKGKSTCDSVFKSKDALSATVSTGEHYKINFSQPIHCFKEIIERIQSVTNIQQEFDPCPFPLPRENVLVIDNTVYEFQLSSSVPEGGVLKHVNFQLIDQVSEILKIIKQQLVYNSLLQSCLKYSSAKDKNAIYDASFTFQISVNVKLNFDVHFLFDDIFHNFSIDTKYNVTFSKSLSTFSSELYSSLMKKVLSAPVISRAVMKEILENQRKAFEESILSTQDVSMQSSGVDYNEFMSCVHSVDENHKLSSSLGNMSMKSCEKSEYLSANDTDLDTIDHPDIDQSLESMDTSSIKTGCSTFFQEAETELNDTKDFIEQQLLTLSEDVKKPKEECAEEDTVDTESLSTKMEAVISGDIESQVCEEIIKCEDTFDVKDKDENDKVPVVLTTDALDTSEDESKAAHPIDTTIVRILSPSQPNSASKLLSVDVLVVENSYYSEKRTSQTSDESGSSIQLSDTSCGDDSTVVKPKSNMEAGRNETVDSGEIYEEDGTGKQVSGSEEMHESNYQAPPILAVERQQPAEVKLINVTTSCENHSSSIATPNAVNIQPEHPSPSLDSSSRGNSSGGFAFKSLSAESGQDVENEDDDDIREEKVPVVKKRAKKGTEKKETNFTRIKIKPLVKPPAFEGGEENLQPPPVTIRIKRKRGRKPRPKVELIPNLDDGSDDPKAGPIKIKISGLNLSKPTTQKVRVKRKHEENAWPGPKKKAPDAPVSLPNTAVNTQDETVRAPSGVQESKSTLSTFRIPRKKTVAPSSSETRANVTPAAIGLDTQEMMPKFRPVRQQSECGPSRVYPKNVISEPLPVYRGPQRIHSRSSSVSPRLPRNTPRNVFNGAQPFRQPHYVYRPQPNNLGTLNNPLMHNVPQHPVQNRHAISPAHNMSLNNHQSHLHINSQPHAHANPQPVVHSNPQSVNHPNPPTLTHPNHQTLSHPNGQSHTRPNSQAITHSNSQPLNHMNSQPLSHANHQPLPHHNSQPLSHPNSQPVTHPNTQTMPHQNSQPIAHPNPQTISHPNSQSMPHPSSQAHPHLNSQALPHNSRQPHPRAHSQTLARVLSSPQHMQKPRQQIRQPMHQNVLRNMQQMNSHQQFLSPRLQFCHPRQTQPLMNTRHQVETSDSALSPGCADYKPVEPPKIIPLERGQWRASCSNSNLENGNFKH